MTRAVTLAAHDIGAVTLAAHDIGAVTLAATLAAHDIGAVTLAAYDIKLGCGDAVCRHLGVRRCGLPPS